MPKVMHAAYAQFLDGLIGSAPEEAAAAAAVDGRSVTSRRTIQVARRSIKKKPALNAASASAGDGVSQVPDHVMAELRSLRLPDREGFSLLPWVRCLILCSQDGEKQDVSTTTNLTLSKWFLKKRHIVAMNVASEILGKTADRIKQFGKRLAALVLYHDRSARDTLERQVTEASDDKKVLVYTYFNTEDETELPVSVMQTLGLSQDFIDHMEGAQQAEAAAGAGDTLAVHGRGLTNLVALERQFENECQIAIEREQVQLFGKGGCKLRRNLWRPTQLAPVHGSCQSRELLDSRVCTKQDPQLFG